ncbi:MULTISPECIES: sensor histidine kinase [Prochlorococcus]|uniref:histidine kinase n=1 Tax=Prochlorococcus marinus (strain SARG / CCMP1375 / SS120) TaxID=167539 RepID=Q7V9U0_PROMA|nr:MULTISPECIES: HAMP domain-containing histidine kinase [Prochlorococcus]AAQ00778.1 Signal transduction histidine kinase [Prochlorococcus marinus subsp. marinus str. CCMP1375]KGG10727.1 Signal transduction histidine kinase [Prochlorococcus marinus str. LG]KGG21149.1 Signal transduction histidine kinase [Prochlorococcus marinus str. SS2]KGG23973.1 Signal transduction histidine kinase [Prochlorococcus marinus str. SS35]
MVNTASISSIQQRMALGAPTGSVDEQIVRRLWWAALDILQEQILLPMNLEKGLWLASPLPALYESKLLARLQGWVWAPEELSMLSSPYAGLLPASTRSIHQGNVSGSKHFRRLPLRKNDGQDPLLIILTPEVQIALALQGEPGKRNLIMRSDPETLTDVLNILDQRLNLEAPEQAKEIRDSLADLGQLTSNEDVAKVFWPLIASRLAGIAPSLNIQTYQNSEQLDQHESQPPGEISLLEALTHEIRTPLATIRTLIRSILRREDLAPTVVSRLKEIDAECTEQIDRFGLIFNAVELERNQTQKSDLAKTDLGNILEILFPVWEQQLNRRGIKLQLDITPDLPEVLSDPERLELMLGGLIDRNTRGIQNGGILLLELRPAGQRLKLKITSNFSYTKQRNESTFDQNSDLGTVLSWNPNTGSLQLTQAATQRLLASLGGRLIRRRDRGITIFFPTAEIK